MSSEQISVSQERVSRQLGELPTSLEVVCKLMMMLRNPTQENEEVAKVLMTDRELTMRLITRLAMKDREKLQSASRNLSQSSDSSLMATLFDSVLHMGYKAILRLVSALSVGQILASEFRGYGYQKRDLWIHSVTTALAAQRLYEVLIDTNRPSQDPSLGFIAGIMHDVGKAGLNYDLAKETQKVTAELKNKRMLWVKLEKEICGIDHCSLGAKLVKQWQLPKSIIDAVKQHHNPKASCQLGAIIHLADYCARFINPTGGVGNYRCKIKPEALEYSELTSLDIERVIAHALNDKETINLYATT